MKIFTAHSLPSRAIAVLAFALLSALCAYAGGPYYVAGASYFQSTTMGQPLVWSQGQINYFTDQGDLSPILPNAAANALVADAFSQWTSVPTAAVNAIAAGQLAEDVSGSTISVTGTGIIAGPADILPSAVGTPVGVVYDYDGSVTDALMGAGASDPSQCFSNAVFGGADNFGNQGNFAHALVVINGQCAQQSSQLTDVEYRLVRVVGEVLGLGWSQLNLNVITGNPPATADDYAGFPVMHPIDPISCVPIAACYPNPYQLTADDQAAISRLYPVTAQNLGSFPGKQVFAGATARIHGSVWFTDPAGNPTQPMQGVNVVARWIDPSTGKASGRYAVSAVSGFLYTGNAGNAVTGVTDALGVPYNQWGSTNQAVEGFFDLAGLPIPNGANSAQYLLSVEAVDPQWSKGVNPYDEFQVVPSGPLQQMVVTVALGGDTEQDILMAGSAQPMPQWANSETWGNPAAVPPSGDWIGGLNSYGQASYFLIPAQANRTLSVAVTAFDDSGAASESKSAPVIGMWSQGDPQGMTPPALTTSPFNEIVPGLTRLDTQVFTSKNFLIGIADLRGDGRPDYHYHAHVLYGDSVSPPRVSVSGNAITLKGIGFFPGLTVQVGNRSATPLAVNANQMVFAAPALRDGAQTITINDPASGSFSTMTGALTFGAASTDSIVWLSAANASTPVGTQAVHPIVVRVIGSNGIPVSGATIGWSASNAAALSVCGSTAACSAITDAGGLASTWVTPGAAGTATITATLAPGVYSSTKSVATTLSGTESASDIGVTTPYLWIAQGATLNIPLTARVLSNGAPQSGTSVKFTLSGTGALSATNAVSDNNGFATVTIALTQFTATTQVSACVAPKGSPCQTIYMSAVAASLQNLQPVAGLAQAISQGQSLQPLTVRVTDSSSPPNPVMGATVTFQTTVMRTKAGVSNGNPVAPTILSVNQNRMQSDVNGLASVLPAAGSFTGTLQIEVSATTGMTAWLQSLLQVFPAIAATGGPLQKMPSSPRLLADPIRRYLPVERE